MSEILELYFEVAYQIIGRIIYGKKFSKQAAVPTYIKAIAGLLPVIVLIVIIWIVIKFNN